MGFLDFFSRFFIWPWFYSNVLHWRGLCPSWFVSICLFDTWSLFLFIWNKIALFVSLNLFLFFLHNHQCYQSGLHVPSTESWADFASIHKYPFSNYLYFEFVLLIFFSISVLSLSPRLRNALWSFFILIVRWWQYLIYVSLFWNWLFLFREE